MFGYPISYNIRERNGGDVKDNPRHERGIKIQFLHNIFQEISLNMGKSFTYIQFKS